jgi:tetratricopeptide (TPR) repeat protein
MLIRSSGDCQEVFVLINRRRKPTAFICYAHKDEKTLDELLSLVGEAMEPAEVWHDRQIKPGTDWYPDLKERLRGARIAIVLVSPNLVESNFVRIEEIPFILAKRRVGGMIYLPILIRGWNEIKNRVESDLDWLRDQMGVFPYGKALEDYPDRAEAFDLLRSKLSAAAAEAYQQPRGLIDLANRWPEDKVNVTRLPSSGKDCFGREDALSRIEKCWRTNITNIFSIIAAGGYGKSTVVDQWLQRKLSDKSYEFEKVFAWSFYNQGTKENEAFSAQSFIEEGLRFFGDTQPELGSAWDKGERLARLVGELRAIVVLDGLEPLQWSFGQKGAVKDPGLITFLSGLAETNRGLCLVTSREPLTGISAPDDTIVELRLSQLPAHAGREILRVNMVLAPDAKLETLSGAVRHNALAVTLLAEWLTRMPIPRKHTHEAAVDEILASLSGVSSNEITAGQNSSTTDAVLAIIVNGLEGTPELELLRLLGLFDQPCHKNEISAVVSGAPIAGLTKRLSDREARMAGALANALYDLADLRLLSFGASGMIDTHPLIRNYVGRILEAELLAGAQQAHGRLADYLEKLALSCPHPETLDQAMPMYRAVHHRSQASALEQAYGYYAQNLVRENEKYSQNVLAAYGNDIAVLTPFFERHWTKLRAAVPYDAHPTVLRDVAVSWQTMGRWDLAREAFEASLNSALEYNDLAEASFSASWLSELLVVRGHIDEAVIYGRKAIEYGKASGDELSYKSALSSAADALHQRGKLDEARVLFDEGIAFQRALPLGNPDLKSFMLQGYHYAVFEMTLGNYGIAEAWCRAEMESGRAEAIGLLTFALNHIALGKAILGAGRQKRRSLTEAEAVIQTGVAKIRESRDLTFLPPALLTKAELLRVQGRFEEAWLLLKQATMVTSNGMHMPLAMIDTELEMVRLRLATKHIDRPNLMRTLAHIGQKISSLRYLRRESELSQLKTTINQPQSKRRPWWMFFLPNR